ncbi:MAG: outer membrane protein assembly factor BamD [Gammaproteobacteria bacterium]
MHRYLPLLLTLALTAAILAGCSSGPKKIPAAKTLYKRAQTSLSVHAWKRAASQYRLLVSTYPFGQYATPARLKMIYAYYRAGNTDEAANQADQFTKENPASPYASYALFMKGISYASAMEPGLMDSLFNVDLARRTPVDQKESFAAFKLLIKRYPKTEYASKAKQWMVFVRDRLARYNLNVARFYASRKEWVAAVDRASAVVTQFSETPSAKPALKIMSNGYHALGEKKLAAAADAWYQYNYGSGRSQEEK